MKSNEEFCASLMEKGKEYKMKKNKIKRVVITAFSLVFIIAVTFTVTKLSGMKTPEGLNADSTTQPVTVHELLSPEEMTSLSLYESESIISEPDNSTDVSSVQGGFDLVDVVTASDEPITAEGSLPDNNLWCIREGETMPEINMKTVISSSSAVLPETGAAVGSVVLSEELKYEINAHKGDDQVLYNVQISVITSAGEKNDADFLKAEADRISAAIKAYPWYAACAVGVNTYTDHGVSTDSLFVIAPEQFFDAFPADPAYGYYLSFTE